MVTKTSTCVWTTKRVLCVLSIVCLVLRLSHVSYERYQANQSNQVHQPFESEIIARNIVDGKGYSFPYYGHLKPTANAPPGIVFVLAAIYAFKLPNPTLAFPASAGCCQCAVDVTYLEHCRAHNGTVRSMVCGFAFYFRY